MLQNFFPIPLIGDFFYWRPASNLSLPTVPITLAKYDAQLLPFPPSSSPFQLLGFVDASHANDLRNRRSTTGHGFLLASGVVAYPSHTQTTTATSKIEAEFLAAAEAAKLAKYLRSILRELVFPQVVPTPIYKDNELSLPSKWSTLAVPLLAHVILIFSTSPSKIRNKLEIWN